MLTSKEGGADEMTLSIIKQLTDTIAKSVKEMTLTVTFTPPAGKAISNSVTTYFVDYSKEVKVGLPGG